MCYSFFMITKICEICGGAFQVKPYRDETARFCSQQCGGKWHMSVRTMSSQHKIGNKYRSGTRPANAFPKGHATWNKDMNGIHLSPHSEFKPGYVSHKRLPVGAVTVRPDKNGRDRAFVKTGEPSDWKLRAVLVWETANGPLPPGFVVHHKDRDTLNDAHDNLEAMTRKEHMAEHRSELRSISS